jgi:ABC-2 type transport system ATP-binding protein
MNVLEVQELRKTYRRSVFQAPVHALKGISFSLPQGSVTGFLGANGAGKTTTIKCLLNLAFADSGTVQYFGSPEFSSEARKRIGFLPERPYFYDYLTGLEFLKFYGQLSLRLTRRDLADRAKRLLVRVGLDHAKDRPLRSYSKGMLQRVGIAQALIHSPDLVILDEPMTGLDPDGRFEVREIILETAAQGTAVFFSSHLLPDAERICSRLVILKKGELVYQGSTEELLSKASAGFRLRWRQQDGSTQSELLAGQSEGQAQTRIDELRRQGGVLLECGPERLSLEEVFMRVGFDARENSR